MVKLYAELQCDGCGCAEHFATDGWRVIAREYGWIITRAGKHYCSKKCKEATK